MYRIKNRDTCGRRAKRGRAFTLVEVLVATSLAAIVLAAVLAAYLFLGRNLTRLINVQQQEVSARNTVSYFTNDISGAIALTAATATALTLTKQAAGGTTTISYVYAADAGTLARTEGAATQTLISGLTAFSFLYFNERGTQVNSSPQSVKAVEFAYTSEAGSTTSGTRASYSSVSPRVVLRNKAVLQ